MAITVTSAEVLNRRLPAGGSGASNIFPMDLYNEVIPNMKSNTTPEPYVISTSMNSDTDYL